MAVKNAGQRRDIDTVPRVSGNLDRAQPQCLDSLQAAIERWRLDRNDVAGAGENLETQVETLECARGHDDLVRGDTRARPQIATGNLAS